MKLPRRHPILLLSFTCAVLSSLAAAKDDLPVLKSHSKVITIIDGDHVKSNYWALMPERNPEFYYVEIPMKPHTVTFHSDIDSITFPMKYGEQRDFVILLNDKISCPTRIRAEYRKLQSYSRAGTGTAASGDTIPFRLGDNDKIYVKGRLNGGAELDFQFDLGCGGSIIKKSSVARVSMHFDGTINLMNSDGNNVVPISSSNQLQIENLHWEGLGFAVADNMTHREDGLLGNILFQNKVVEINYDRGVMKVHDTLPAMAASCTKHEIILDGVVPFVRGSLVMDGRQREGWFMFDTGAYTSILFSSETSPASKLFGELRSLLWKNRAAGPRLAIGKHTFANFNYSVKNEKRNDDVLGLLGNDILKRFNVILDNQSGVIYLQPNSLTGTPFRNPEGTYLARFIVVGGLISLSGCGWLFYRRQSKRRAKEEALTTV